MIADCAYSLMTAESMRRRTVAAKQLQADAADYVQDLQESMQKQADSGEFSYYTTMADGFYEAVGKQIVLSLQDAGYCVDVEGDERGVYLTISWEI